jgi:hypothetical protein
MIAIIKTDPPCDGPYCLIVQEIDGAWRGIGWIRQYELSPGPHTIKFLYAAPYLRGKTAVIVAFTAEPGHMYTARANANFAQLTWKPEIVDEETKRPISTKIGEAEPY